LAGKYEPLGEETYRRTVRAGYDYHQRVIWMRNDGLPSEIEAMFRLTGTNERERERGKIMKK
jgi:hypothetical protein